LQGQNKDWVSGEVSVPKFHCPRCRDHYYGLTPFPCDEELARLIREGLWHTGETATSPDKGIRHGMMRASLSSSDTHRNRKSSEGDLRTSSKLKLPPLDTNTSSLLQNSSQDNSNTTTNKRKKKISFALDNLGADGSPSVSEIDLNKGGNSGGRKRRIGDESRKGSAASDGASNSSLDRYGLGAGAQKKSDNQSSTSKLLGSQTQLGGDLLGKGTDSNLTGKTSGDNRSRKNSKGTGTGDSLGGITSHTNGMVNQRGEKESTDDGNSLKRGLGDTMSGIGTTAGNFSDYAGTDGTSRNFSDKNGSTGKGGYSTGETTEIGGTTSKNRSNTSRDGKDCDVANCENKANSKLSSSSHSRDSGGNAKKSHKAPPGYMRAASPSQSDWGDPTHAKKWINNVAPKPTSHFKYNTDDHDDDDEFSSHTRGSWRNRLKKPPKSEEPDDSLLLPMGPSLTRAFTFSYVPHAKLKN